jgi:HAD superfamily hydrolase (TIGR01490 family)
MGTLAAVFDIDHTLVRGGTERLFFRYLLRYRRLSLGRALAFLVRLAAAPRKRFVDKSYLAGLAAADMERLARRCFKDIIVPRLRPRGVARVRFHQSRGHQIGLLSGTLSFLALPLQEHLGAAWLIATEITVCDHILTGEIKGLHPRGENKRVLLMELAGRQGLDLSGSYAYGDHEADIPLLSSVGRPVAVNPTRPLAREARRRGWPIEYF